MGWHLEAIRGVLLGFHRRLLQSTRFLIMSPFLEQLNVHSNIPEQFCTLAVLRPSVHAMQMQELPD